MNLIPCLSWVSIHMLKICKENDENSSYMSSLKTLRVSAQYLQFPRFRALLFVKRARFLVMEESWDIVWFISTWQNIVAGGCENCREMTSCFGTRSGSKKPLSFSATFLGLAIFKYRVEGRGAAKQRDKDHVS